MGVREETLQMLRDGLTPKEISRRRGVSIKTTLGYLDQLVGQGGLRRADILFSIPREIREAAFEAINEVGIPSMLLVPSELERRGFNIDKEDIEVVCRYGGPRHILGDMYVDIRDIETYLHWLIRNALEEEYGEDEQGWWRQGIPEPVRKSCRIRQEEDTEPVLDPYCYTDLLDLWHIIDKQWTILSKVLPDQMTSNKAQARRNLVQLNTIRRNVMHPVRGVVPSKDDFEFVRELRNLLVGTAFML